MPLKPGTKAEALFDFMGASPEDLPFKKNEVLTVTAPSEDPNWWYASNAQGKKGMIPANYVELIDGHDTVGSLKNATLPRDASGKLMPMPWFHGKIDRELAESLLMPREDGMYLVRESTNFPGDYTLCVAYQKDVDHYRIQGIKGKITIDEEVFFDSLEELISHYEKESDGLCTRLRRPRVKEGGRELVDASAFQDGGWEIPARDLVRGGMLGSGQFGDVFEATYQGETVAVKTLKNIGEAEQQEFLAEAAVMTKLRHKNLVCLVGVVLKSKPIMIVSEFMSKGCLLDYLRSRGRSVVTREVQEKLILDIAEAMAYLESKKFVHRDLATRNVLVSEDNSAKVSDFGLAKDSAMGQLDAGKLPIKWTAPEALRQKVSTSKSDVWSFGVVMWEIYSYGRSPYPRMSQKEVVDSIVKGYRMEIPDACPPEVYESTTLPCWDIDPVKRPTFAKLLQLLNQ